MQCAEWTATYTVTNEHVKNVFSHIYLNSFWITQVISSVILQNCVSQKNFQA